MEDKNKKTYISPEGVHRHLEGINTPTGKINYLHNVLKKGNLISEKTEDSVNQVLTNLYMKGGMYSAAGNNLQSRDFLSEAFEMHEKASIQDKDYNDKGVSYWKMAEISEKLGNLEEAADLFAKSGRYNTYKRDTSKKRVEDISRKIDNPDIPVVVFERAGRVGPAIEYLEKNGRLEDAAILLERNKMYEQSAKMFERIGNKRKAAKNFESAGALVSAACLNEELGDYRAAANLWSKKAESRFDGRYHNHRDTAVEYERAAECWENAGNSTKAKEILLKAAEYWSKTGYYGTNWKAAEIYKKFGYLRPAAEALENGEGLRNHENLEEAASLWIKLDETERAADNYEKIGKINKAKRLRRKIKI
jgi:tetratricopeptide (TPR) repeat protein